MSYSETIPSVIVNRCLVFNEHDEFLLLQRAPHINHSAGKYEFIGGKVDYEDVIKNLSSPNHGANVLEIARSREIDEEADIHVEVISPLRYSVARVLDDGRYKGALYLALFSVARLTGGEVRLSSEHSDSVWAPSDRVLDYDLTPESEEAFRALSMVIG
ncbi:MAG TPA: NUDIX domain-containing protein [Candidatus Saccharimonadales bacterium]|nr:NUDIX domain-containing protein [Candidatus Saccharimonadales bacterium]